jgi:AraC family transcriptional regulator, positive regulator of tynA and feaB
MVKAWSTADIHPRDRVGYWVDHVCEFCRVDSEPQRGLPLFGKGTFDDLAGIMEVAEGAGSAQVFTRSARQIARGGNDAFRVIVQTSGRSLISQDGREAILEPGDLVLLDRMRPYRQVCNSDFLQTTLTIPRHLLSQRIGAAELFTTMRIDGSANFGGLLSPLLQQLPSQIAAIPGEVRARIGENVLDLVATALLVQHERAQVSAGMTLVRVKFWIETHLADDLSAAKIAAECDVTVRHLNRLFSREGTSLMNYVWERRLARCHRDLTNPTMSHRAIGEVAIAAGFKDLSHFSHAYRARYGRTARDERAQAATPRRGHE